MKKLLIVFIVGLFPGIAMSQPLSDKREFTYADTLRGSIGEGRDWWDVLKYDLHVRFDIPNKSIAGYSAITYKVLKPGKIMQIDLQVPMKIDSCVFVSAKSKKTYFTFGRKTEPDVSFIYSPEGQEINGIYTLFVYYHGVPKVAQHAPWDGGLIWTKDDKNNPWVSIACQGLGASVWYPCKDHQSDEPDSAGIHITCPDTLMAVSNGRFRGKTLNSDGTATYNWAVTEPINNYNIIPNIGKYVNFSEVYKGEKGDLDMNYWVLDYNLEKAKKHFADAPRMMKAFEHWFGPYPFYKDGYKLVDAPFLGMEHQSNIAYGNKYQNGYLGRDLSASGWGLKWDFIIVHESGHEWFANNITTKDIADMWVHEGFTHYSEALFTEYYYGKEAGDAYSRGTRLNIANDVPVIGNYGVNSEGSGDMYYKAGAMIHTIRQLMSDDEKFRKLLRDMNKDFYHQTVTTQQVEAYINKAAGRDLSKVYDQYLRTTQIPVLQYKIEKGMLTYQWANCVKGFDMPVKVSLAKGKYTFIYPTEKAQQLKTKLKSAKDFDVHKSFFVEKKQM